jgi:ATP-dependent DNA ligase
MVAAAMTLPVKPPITPMLAKSATEIPRGEGWVYEPKWDGFRALVYLDGEVLIDSRSNQPLGRYFPELVEAVPQAFPKGSVIDGEIVVAGRLGLDFDILSQRIHPAESRVRRLAQETPAHFIAFDMLALDGRDVREERMDRRRELLEGAFKPHPRVNLTPQTIDADEAQSWFVQYEGAGFDGIIAKRAELPYIAGERVMAKIKHVRTADCVAGGYRVHKSGTGVGSLLLGLYDEEGNLNYVGHTSSFTDKQRIEVQQKLKPLEGKESFAGGRVPGGPSRWSGKKDLTFVSIAPELVCEVNFEQLQNGRFRHNARFLRWRPDKAPRECGYEQLDPPNPFSLNDVLNLG